MYIDCCISKGAIIICPDCEELTYKYSNCPFHINAKRSDMISKLLEEDYYQPLANSVDINKHQLIKWYDSLTHKELLEILNDEKYGLCWC